MIRLLLLNALWQTARLPSEWLAAMLVSAPLWVWLLLLGVCCCEAGKPQCPLECEGVVIPSRLFLTLTYISGDNCADGQVFDMDQQVVGGWGPMEFIPVDGCQNPNAVIAFKLECFPRTRCEPFLWELESGCGGISVLNCNNSPSVVCSPLQILYDSVVIPTFCFDDTGTVSIYSGVITQ